MNSSSSGIYLDHAATTPMDPRVLDVMQPFLSETFGNPSSLHRFGKPAGKALQKARETLASCLKALPEEIVFTGGGTEADNLAVLGVAQALREKGRHIVISAIEHPAVLKPCEYLESMGWEITRLPVDMEGFVSVSDLKAALRSDTVLVSIMQGNNEVGTIQPLMMLGRLLQERNILFHTDAVQTVGKLPIDLETLPVDYLSISGHKLYGPKGIGALYIRKSAPSPKPLLFGGGQESGLRSGTENVAGIVGITEALRLCTEEMPEASERLRRLQEYFIQQVLHTVKAAGLTAILNGPADISRRVPGNINFSFPPIEGESLVLRLDLKGIAVSSGSACHSAVIEPSPVVLALGKSPEIAKSTVRFSMGRTTTAESLDHVIAVLPEIIRHLMTRKAQPV